MVGKATVFHLVLNTANIVYMGKAFLHLSYGIVPDETGDVNHGSS